MIHSEEKQGCGGEQSPVQHFSGYFHHVHLPIDIIKCLQGMLVQSVPMEQTHDTQFHAYQN